MQWQDHLCRRPSLSAPGRLLWLASDSPDKLRVRLSQESDMRRWRGLHPG